MYLTEVEKTIDPWTGILLTPSLHGKDCLGNREHAEMECCCDECNYYLECYPDWESAAAIDEYLKK